MKRVLIPLLAFALAGPLVLRGDNGISNEQAMQMLRRQRDLERQVETLELQVKSLKAQVGQLLSQNETFREQLIRRGVDVEQLLDPGAGPARQPAAGKLVFESPESLAEFIRENFSQRVRGDMTRLQREAASKEFDRWLDAAGLLVTQVDWVVQVRDAWRVHEPEDATLHYASDRQAMVQQVATLRRCMTRLEMLEMQVFRLKAIQNDRTALHKQRISEMVDAPAARKPLAEKIMRQAYADLVEVNESLRSAKIKLDAQRRLAKGDRSATTQPEDEWRIMIHARGARDETVDMTLFCNRFDAERLMAAPRGSRIKIRGWLTDIALAERIVAIGFRLDRCEVKAVNVEPPPPPADPAGGVESKSPTP